MPAKRNDHYPTTQLARSTCWADASGGAMRISQLSACLLTALLLAVPASSKQARRQWAPPTIWTGTDIPEATGAQDLVPYIGIGSFRVKLGTTLLADAASHFNAKIGYQGDASEALSWVCLQGGTRAGPWALWLESGEIDGPTIGGFLLLPRPGSGWLDHRCIPLRDAAISLPIPLQIGMSGAQVVAALGPPTSQSENHILYSHHLVVTLNPKGDTPGEPLDLDTDLYIRLDGGVVAGFQVWRTTSS